MLAVLVVEDEPLIRMMLADAFEAAGFNVGCAENADRALDMFKARSFDALVTDIQMPGTMDGLGLVRHVRDGHPTLPVVIVSAGSPDLSDGIFRTIPFVRKPFDPDRLVETVNRAVDRGD